MCTAETAAARWVLVVEDLNIVQVLLYSIVCDTAVMPVCTINAHYEYI